MMSSCEPAACAPAARRMLHATTAVCPACLRELAADVFADAQGAVWMERACPEHGPFATRIAPDAVQYERLRSLAFPPTPPLHAVPATAPCPRGCGTCGRHERRGTLFEIEVTRNCNLHCPVCFMSAETGADDPTLDEIDALYDVIAREAGTDGAVQITGGEPTCRADLPEVIRRGRAKGFWGIEVNTNGLAIAARDGYLEELAAAGLTGVYLSFDGVTGDVYETTCGRDILAEKLRVVERCRAAGVQVVLSMAVIAGTNERQVGDVLRFCLEHADIVAGLALQPAFASGRFEAHRAMPLTMGDVMAQLSAQSDGLIEQDDIWPLGCSDALCDTGVFLVPGAPPSGVPAHASGFYPATRAMTFDDYRAGYRPDSPQGSVFLDILAARGVQARGGLSVIIMNYMDAYSLDTNRLRACSMMVAVPDGRTIPFCSYHLTDAQGCRVYAPWCKEEVSR